MFQTSTWLARPASVARLSTTPAWFGYIHTSGIRTPGSSTTAWFPQKFRPRKVGVVIVSVRLLPLVVAGALFLPAYNLELAGGRFHGDTWFALGWGAFPAFTGYFANAVQIRLPGILIALGCFLLSAAQRRLSTPARELRRRTQSVSGTRMRSDGSSEALSRERLLAPLDGALAALAVAIFVTACAALAARL